MTNYARRIGCTNSIHFGRRSLGRTVEWHCK